MYPGNLVAIAQASGGAIIARSDAIPVFRMAPQLQTQSGPILVIAGKLHPKLDHDGSSRLFRNGVGTREGEAWHCTFEVIPEGGMVRYGQLLWA